MFVEVDRPSYGSVVLRRTVGVGGSLDSEDTVTTAKGVETSVTTTNTNSPSQHYTITWTINFHKHLALFSCQLPRFKTFIVPLPKPWPTFIQN